MSSIVEVAVWFATTKWPGSGGVVGVGELRGPPVVDVVEPHISLAMMMAARARKGVMREKRGSIWALPLQAHGS